MNEIMVFSAFKKHEQLAKFLFVGCTNFLVSFTVFNFCYTYLKLGDFLVYIVGGAGLIFFQPGQTGSAITFNAALANIVGYACGVMNSFVWNKIWTFKAKFGAAKQFYYFIVLNIFCIILSTGIITLFVDVLGAGHKVVWIYTMAAIFLIIYVACKYWVFNKNTYSNQQ